MHAMPRKTNERRPKIMGLGKIDSFFNMAIFGYLRPKFDSSPLKSYQNPIGKEKVFQPPFFTGYVKFQGCIREISGVYVHL